MIIKENPEDGFYVLKHELPDGKISGEGKFKKSTIINFKLADKRDGSKVLSQSGLLHKDLIEVVFTDFKVHLENVKHPWYKKIIFKFGCYLFTKFKIFYHV